MFIHVLCFKPHHILSNDVAVIQWISLCHKNRMTTECNNTLACTRTSLTTSVSALCFLIEILFILKAIKSHFKRSHDKQNLKNMVVCKTVS